MTVDTKFREKHPFISCIKTGDTEYVGIIINLDNNVASIYDISAIKTLEERRQFLELGETWWWESNRKIPINIFLKNQMQNFKFAIKTFNAKDVKIIFGPVVNLGEIAEKRIKRKSIQLVRSVKNNRR
jgi:hypothetical protein